MVNVKAIMPVQEMRVPAGKADPLKIGLDRIGEPVTIRNRHETRIIDDR